MNPVPAAARDRVGSLLRGKWRLDKLLGVGGMAWVYAATHRNRSRAALKLLLPEHSEDEDTRRRFLREGYVANTIGHPGVVAVFDDDEDHDGTAFLVMELLVGGTLNDVRRARGGKLPVSAALAIAEQVLDVLAVAHDKGIVHRDIKPTNLFLTCDGRVKVLDFGIAQLGRGGGAEAESSDTVMGTFAYMAPEQARADWDRVGPHTDLWAVGATLFRLLTGQFVHPAKNDDELMLMAASATPRSLASVAPELPPGVCALVDRALAPDPAERWSSALEMQRALLGALAGLGSVAAGDELDTLARDLPAMDHGEGAATEVDDGAMATVAPKQKERPAMLAMSRRDVLERLARFGVRGNDVYLVDTIPLLEMIWADGVVQPEETALLDAFLTKHVAHLNSLAGEEVLSLEQARAFVARFTRERPDPGLMRLLREMLPDAGLGGEAPHSIARRGAILDFCLDIGAACVAGYPGGDHGRFCDDEKKAFAEIFRTLSA